MDYILKKIDQKIQFHSGFNEKDKLRIHYQVRIEYSLMLILGYLWNKNYKDNISDKTKEEVNKRIFKPTIGQIIYVIRKLDVSNEFLSDPTINNVMTNYLSTRNEEIGHGFVYDDGIDMLLDELKSIINQLESSTVKLLNQNLDIIFVRNFDGENYTGINFKGTDVVPIPWISPKTANGFKINNVYILSEEMQYYRISPFIHVNSDDQYFIYVSVEDRLTGNAKYNQINQTAKEYITWEDFLCLSTQEDAIRRKVPNGTIVNNYAKNYKNYYDFGMKKRITEFLNNRSFVAATLWGHGGVGKTATVQSVIDDFLNQGSLSFDYIVFTSAKDRQYNVITGGIEEIQDSVDTFDLVIKKVNEVLGNGETIDVNYIANHERRMLLIIDDFETFSKDEKNKIQEFINQLDVTKHKVIITTRANLIVGEEIPTNELDSDKTIEFIRAIFSAEYANYKDIFERGLTDQIKNKIHFVTSGRPIFIYQFAYMLMARGFNDSLWRELSQSEAAKDFLYGRIYNYLSDDATDLFITIGMLLNNADDKYLTERLKYIVNMEDDSDKFNRAMKELVKLRIVEELDESTFRVYSKELLTVMKEHRNKKNSGFIGGINSRLNQVKRYKNNLDIDSVLLQNADEARYSRNLKEVEDLYRQILNRKKSVVEIRVKALLNLTSHIVTTTGNHDYAIDIFKEYSEFLSDKAVLKMFVSYLITKGYYKDGIRVLSEYFSINSKTNKENIELFGFLLTIRSTYWINEREEVKSRQHNQYISKEQRELLNQEFVNQSEEMKDIFRNQGHILFNAVKNKKLNEYSPAARQNIEAGLYKFIEICIRIKKLDYALDVCEYGLENFHIQYNDSLKKYLSRIQQYITENQTASN
ncbi:NB-ARC domain-containing protein [Paenibacillus planticolens]|uniref:NB-ARC domain-containing protein n=1 Tax=Paenibacillus planticolens TaxID=2654976 RepID=A0ABX1ZRN7_9BACL|nr:NB-ARC domain-containing protein [Paenibacillus planticolens]NOV02724.1 hypothetical protein [Paenibacillus planticolens]